MLFRSSGVAIPLKEDIYTVGTIVKVKQMLKLPNNLARVVVQGLATAKIKKYCSNTKFFQVETVELPYTKTDTIESEVLARKVMELTKQYLSISGRSVSDRLPELGDDVNVFLNRLAMQIIYREGQKQQLLEETDTEKRLLDFCSVLTHETELSKIDKKIAKKVKAQIDKGQKEYYLREQMKAISDELGDGVDEINAYKEKIKSANMPEEVEKKAEIGRAHV